MKKKGIEIRILILLIIPPIPLTLDGVAQMTPLLSTYVAKAVKQKLWASDFPTLFTSAAKSQGFHRGNSCDRSLTTAEAEADDGPSEERRLLVSPSRQRVNTQNAIQRSGVTRNKREAERKKRTIRPVHDRNSRTSCHTYHVMRHVT